MTNGDTWRIGQWKARAREREQLVADKTADVAVKNRELEIEAGLIN